MSWPFTSFLPLPAICKENRCQPTSFVRTGDACSGSYECYGMAYCFEGVCGRAGAYCEPSVYPWEWCDSGNGASCHITKPFAHPVLRQATAFITNAWENDVKASRGSRAGTTRNASNLAFTAMSPEEVAVSVAERARFASLRLALPGRARFAGQVRRCVALERILQS